jgi:hypothetical protein
LQDKAKKMRLKIHGRRVEMNSEISIPLSLIEEMDRFVVRNALVDLGKRRNGNLKYGFKCCNRCLKAFALGKARELGLNQETIGIIDALFDCETGHDGYYLDADNLGDCRFSLHRDA